MSVLQCLSTSNPKGVYPSVLYKIKQVASDLDSRGCGVFMRWISAHKGILDNEEADRYAKLSLLEPEPCHPKLQKQ